LLAFVALTALAGLRTGLVATALSLAGLVAGAVAGARIAPGLVSGGVRSEYAALLALVGAIAGALLLRWAAGIVGSFVRGGLRVRPPLGGPRSVAGAGAAARWGPALRGGGGGAAAGRSPRAQGRPPRAGAGPLQ